MNIVQVKIMEKIRQRKKNPENCVICGRKSDRFSFNPEENKYEHVCLDHYKENKERLRTEGKTCSLCQIRFLPNTFILHHTSYSPEKTIEICRSCHSILHNSTPNKTEIKPAHTEAEKFYTKKPPKTPQIPFIYL